MLPAASIDNVPAGTAVGALDDAIEVQVGGVLSLPGSGADAQGISAHVDGTVGSFSIASSVPGVVVYTPTGSILRPIGGASYDRVSPIIGGEFNLCRGGARLERVFGFESVSESLFSTENVAKEIRYGAAEAEEMITVEDILMTPISASGFDNWLDRKLDEALTQFAAGEE